MSWTEDEKRAALALLSSIAESLHVLTGACTPEAQESLIEQAIETAERRFFEGRPESPAAEEPS